MKQEEKQISRTVGFFYCQKFLLKKKGSSGRGKEKCTKKERNIAIYKVLKRVYPDISVSGKATSIMNRFTSLKRQ